LHSAKANGQKKDNHECGFFQLNFACNLINRGRVTDVRYNVKGLGAQDGGSQAVVKVETKEKQGN
jgi:hypothetical protein